MKTITLTEKQWDKIQNDSDKQVEMLSHKEIEKIATKLNRKINVPFLDEEKEQVVLVKLVRKIDRYIYSVLPNEFYALIKDSTDGIDDDEADMIKNRVAKSINKAVDIPYIPEPLEQIAFEFIVGQIINALRKGFSVAV